MTAFEQTPPIELPCATCPNRSKISQALAKIGIFRSGEDCPGTDTIDRFTAVKIVGADPFPEDSGDYALLVNSSDSENPQPTVKYLSQEESRTEPCPNDPIFLSPNETVTEAVVNEQGKVRAKIGKGDPDDVDKLKTPFGLNPFRSSRPPLDILSNVRLVTIVDPSENTEH